MADGGAGHNRCATTRQTRRKKTFVFGDTTFNAENEESNINPHSAYCGWACIRYGVGETLMKINDSMELEPWIAEGYELVDDPDLEDHAERWRRAFPTESPVMRKQ